MVDLKNNDVYDMCKTEKIKKIVKIACLCPHLCAVIPISRALGHMADSWHKLKHGWIFYLIKAGFALSNLAVWGYFAQSGFSVFVMLLFTLHMVLMLFMRESMGRSIWGVIIAIVLFFIIVWYTLWISKICNRLSNSGKNDQTVRNDDTQNNRRRVNPNGDEESSGGSSNKKPIDDNQPKYPTSSIDDSDDEDKKREYWEKLLNKEDNVKN